MARNGSGTFTRLYDFTADRDAGSPTNVISADKIDGEFDDISTALTASIAKDGQTTPTADLPMGGFKHTGVATTISARSNYAPVAVLQDGTAQWISASGTDTITATYSPAIPALVSGMELRFRAAAANATTTPTFAPNGLTAKTIVKGANTALVAGDIAGQHHECIVRYNATTDKWHLLNPVYPAGYTVDNLNSLTTDSTGGATGDFIPFVDASESNASNKVLTTDLMANMIANFTTKTAPTVSDKIMIGDAAASGAAKISTVQQLADAHNGLTQKSTPTTSDRVPINDAAASGVAKYSTIGNIQSVLSAVQATQATGTSTALFVTPGVQKYHDSAAKFWAYSILSAGVPQTSATFNISSIGDTATGKATFNFTTSFSTANWSVHSTCEWPAAETSGQICGVDNAGQASGSIVIRSMGTGASSNASLQDPAAYHVVGFGVSA